MRNFISSTDLALWIALITGQVVLCLCIFKKGVLQRLPWFSAYILASTAKSIVFLFLAFLTSYSVYYYGFHIVTHIISALAFLTLIELARRVLPGINLPHNKKALVWLLIALAGIAGFAVLFPLRYVEKRIDVAAYMTIAAAFIVIAFYARSLGLHWSRLVGGVSLTLGLLYLADGVAKALISHSPMAVAMKVRLLSEIVSIVAAVSWTIVILSPWGERQLTEKDLLQLEQFVDHMESDFIQAVRKGKFVTGGSK